MYGGKTLALDQQVFKQWSPDVLLFINIISYALEGNSCHYSVMLAAGAYKFRLISPTSNTSSQFTPYTFLNILSIQAS